MVCAAANEVDSSKAWIQSHHNNIINNNNNNKNNGNYNKHNKSKR